jgi:hypothetical protein
MPLVSKWLSALLKIISSGKLALVIVFILMLFAFAGAALPQQGRVNPEDILQWQLANKGLTALLKPLGLFGVFTSWPFMITLLLLGVNTFTCTILRFIKDGGFACLKGPKAMEKGGFLLLHISLIILLAGGFISTAKKLNGFIILTEGQTFIENHESYIRLAEGPLRKKVHKNFALKMNEIKTKYEKGLHLIDVTSSLDVFEQNSEVAQADIKINHPFTYRSVSFTHKDIGFSPRIQIKEKESGKVLFYSFVMLKSFDTENGKEYRDFLPLSFLQNRTIITVYPDYAMKAGDAVKTSEEPNNPLIRIQVEDDVGKIISKEYLTLGRETSIGEYVFEFTDLRRWASFKVVDDPGYFTVCISFWIGLAALLLRYIPEFKKWSVETDIN